MTSEHASPHIRRLSEEGEGGGFKIKKQVVPQSLMRFSQNQATTFWPKISGWMRACLYQRGAMQRATKHRLEYR